MSSFKTEANLRSRETLHRDHSSQLSYSFEQRGGVAQARAQSSISRYNGNKNYNEQEEVQIKLNAYENKMTRA